MKINKCEWAKLEFWEIDTTVENYEALYDVVFGRSSVYNWMDAVDMLHNLFQLVDIEEMKKATEG